MDKKTILSFALGAVLAALLFASLIIFQIVSPVQQSVSAPKPAPALDKFKVSVRDSNADLYWLVLDAGSDSGIWAKHGLDPELVLVEGEIIGANELKGQVASGIKIGLSVASEALLARANGVPIKILAGYIGECLGCKLYVKADSPIKTIQDLDGKRVGVASIPGDWSYRHLMYLSNKVGIRSEPVALGIPTANHVAALKVGRIDAFLRADDSALRLVDSGELRILVHMPDVLPKPFLSQVVFATDDLIERNPDLVRRFLEATLEAVKSLKENPGYAADLYVKRTNAPRELAVKAVGEKDWRPSGRGTGADLLASVRGNWEYVTGSGIIPPSINLKVEDAVDARFLP